MPIDFHNEHNRLTYARRRAGPDWAHAIQTLVEPRGSRVVDVGCGGGVYCAAWHDLGAASVTGVDFSAAMLSAARECCGQRAGLAFRQAGAEATGLPAGRADIVFQRALIHHLDDPRACFREAERLLSPGGVLIVQDRTLADIARPGSPTHLRGYFFEYFPALLRVERARRPTPSKVEAALRAAGFTRVRVLELRETRRSYASAEEIREDLLARTGRSILHELSDAELRELADHVVAEVRDCVPVLETDSWTLWVADR